jgi:hypothetical protein
MPRMYGCNECTQSSLAEGCVRHASTIAVKDVLSQGVSGPPDRPEGLQVRIGERRPYRCPVCHGTGQVGAGFYTTTTGHWSSSSAAATENCRSCGASGIVWS